MNAECEASGLGLHFVRTLGAMMTEYIYSFYFLLLYFIALQNINNRGAPNKFPPPPETQPLLRRCVRLY